MKSLLNTIVTRNAFAVSILVALNAHGQLPLEVPAELPLPRDDAARLFDDAMLDYDRGDLDAAILKLTRAQELAPHARVLYNLAQLLELVGRRGDALVAFERCLESLEESGNPSHYKNTVQAAVNRLSAMLARVRIEVRPTSASLRLDHGQPLTTIDGRVEVIVEPGSHEILTEHRSLGRVSVNLLAVAGEAQRVIVALGSPPPLQQRVPVRLLVKASGPPVRAGRSPRPRRPESFDRRMLTVILIGTSAAFMASAGVAHLASASRADDWNVRNDQLDLIPAVGRNDSYWAARANNAALSREIRMLDGLKLGLALGGSALAVAGIGFAIVASPSSGQVGWTLAKRW